MFTEAKSQKEIKYQNKENRKYLQNQNNLLDIGTNKLHERKLLDFGISTAQLELTIQTMGKCYFEKI